MKTHHVDTVDLRHERDRLVSDRDGKAPEGDSLNSGRHVYSGEGGTVELEICGEEKAGVEGVWWRWWRWWRW